MSLIMLLLVNSGIMSKRCKKPEEDKRVKEIVKKKLQKYNII